MIGSEVLEKLRSRLEGDVHLREVIRGSTTFLILRILGMIVAYAFTLLVTRKLGASAWGVFALSLTVLQIVSVLGRLGLDSALLRFIAQYRAKGQGKTAYHIYKKSLKIVFSFSLTLTVLVYFLSPVIAEKVFAKEYITPYLRVMSFGILPFTLLFINSESLRSLKKIKEYTAFQNLLPFFIALFITFFVFFALNEVNEMVVLVSYLMGIIIAFVLSFVILRKNFVKLSGEVHEVPLKSILYVSLPMMISSSLFMLMSWVDTVMLGIFRSEGEVGIYNVALRLSMITSFTLAAINSIAAPKFAEFWGKKDMEGLRKVAQQSTKLIFLASTPVLALFLLFPSFFMGLFGEEFKMGVFTLIILTVGQFVNSVCGSVGYILQMTGKQMLVQNVILFSLLINIGLNYLLIPKYGIEGAALASMVTTVMWNVVFLLFIRFRYGFWTIALSGR